MRDNSPARPDSDDSPYPLWAWQFESPAAGCGDLLAFSFADSHRVAIVAEAKACSLYLSQAEGRFTLLDDDLFFKVSVNVFDRDPRSGTGFFCTDAIVLDSFPPVLLGSWRAVYGIVNISASTQPVCPPNYSSSPYTVNIRIDSLILRKAGSDSVVFTPVFEFKDVQVGWYPG